ncbi:MAG: hypothetical protein QNK23_11030 [Crocinitomicaceae bacterium]|nr:hypothetical protein [Crocinitomicaceae bacterium]
MKEENDILDEPFKQEDLPPDFQINRFSFRFDQDELFVKEEQTNSSGSAIGAVVLFIVGLFFTYLVYNGWVSEGYDFTLGVYIFFVIFCFFLAMVVIISAYYLNKAFEFDKEFLRVTKSIGKEELLSKNKFLSVFVKESITTNQYGSVTSRTFFICLRLKQPIKKQNDYQLFNVETVDGSIFNSEEGRDKTEQDAIRIGKIISDYWDIPFSV